MRRVPITGADLGMHSFFGHMSWRYDLHLTDLPASDLTAVAGGGEDLAADFADRERGQQVCAPVASVVHFTADPQPSPTRAGVLPANIITYALRATAVGKRRSPPASRAGSCGRAGRGDGDRERPVQARRCGVLTGDLEELRLVVRRTQELHRFETRR